MIRNNTCVLCSRSLEPILAGGEYWRLVLNRNQDLLGKCFLVLRRHCEAVTNLTSQEWAELHAQLRVTTHALHETFCPDHFNYAFLQNQDRHVHLHVIPRYATPRVFAGEFRPLKKASGRWRRHHRPLRDPVHRCPVYGWIGNRP